MPVVVDHAQAIADEFFNVIGQRVSEAPQAFATFYAARMLDTANQIGFDWGGDVLAELKKMTRHLEQIATNA